MEQLFDKTVFFMITYNVQTTELVVMETGGGMRIREPYWVIPAVVFDVFELACSAWRHQGWYVVGFSIIAVVMFGHFCMEEVPKAKEGTSDNK